MLPRLADEVDGEFGGQLVDVAEPLDEVAVLVGMVEPGVGRGGGAELVGAGDGEEGELALAAPVGVVGAFEGGGLGVVGLDPLLGASAGEDIGDDAVGPGRLAVVEEGVEVGGDLSAPFGMEGAGADVVEGVDGESPGEPERGVEVDEDDEPGVRAVAEDVAELAVDEGEVVGVVVAPDVGVVGVGLAQGVGGVHGRDADGVDADVGHEVERLPVGVEMGTVGRAEREQGTVKVHGAGLGWEWVQCQGTFRSSRSGQMTSGQLVVMESQVVARARSSSSGVSTG